MKSTLQKLPTNPMREDRPGNTALAPAFHWKRILVAVDFTPESRTALRYAIELAQIHSAHLTLLHVVVPPSFMSGFEESPLCKATGEVRTEAQAHLEHWVTAEGEPLADSERVVRVGQPHREIVALATEQRFDVIIMAESRVNWVERFMLGSVTAKVKRRAPCPVLTLSIPRKGRTRSLPVKFAPEEAWRSQGAGRARLRPRPSTT